MLYEILAELIRQRDRGMLPMVVRRKLDRLLLVLARKAMN
jgi:hypothetical protein